LYFTSELLKLAFIRQADLGLSVCGVRAFACVFHGAYAAMKHSRPRFDLGNEAAMAAADAADGGLSL